MGTVGAIKGTLGPLTPKQRLAIKAKQVSAPSLAFTGRTAEGKSNCSSAIVAQYAGLT